MSDRSSNLSQIRKHERAKGRKWHALSVDDVVNSLKTGSSGLNENAIEERRATYGYNEMIGQKKGGALKVIFKQLHQLLIYILLLSATVTAILGHWLDTAVILAVVLANVVIGFMQERKADKAIDALDQLVVSECTVVRDGQKKVIPSRELVPGDVVLLESGNKVPADIRLVYSKGLRIDEAILTGESVPVEKVNDTLSEDIGSVADMVNMAFTGTLVTYGRGRGIVVSTADSTEISRISACMREAEETETPLQKRISSFAIYLSGAVAILAILTFFGGLLAGQEPVFIFLAAVSIAVAAIPEGLPALVTISLALGVKAMANRKAIIRNLPSVETLGSTTVICSDKTGTLTMNQMTVVRVFAGDRNYEVTGTGYSVEGEFLSGEGVALPREKPALMRTLVAGAACNDASLKDDAGIIGDPTEGALLVSAAKGGLYLHLPRLDEIPFESEIQYMATLNKSDDRRKIYIKGVPEKIIGVCGKTLSNDGNVVEIDREAILAQANDMASSALRVIAIAEKEVDQDKETLEDADIKDLIFLGLQGMIDPPRPEAVDAIKRCQGASIRVVMITGDHAVTAGAIAVKLGIAEKGTQIITGDMLEAMDDDALYDIVENTLVYARASPIHKYRIVQQLQKHGEIIAVTGDGVNDAPALKAADIGIAMGVMGTDVAKEASDMILADDNFATIVNAVEEGRHMYNNLQKMLTFLLPTNIGEALVISIAILAGLVIPLMPVHVLWVNLVTSVTCTLPLAMEGKEEGILRRPPRDPKAPLINKRMLARLVIVSSIMMLGAFISFYYALLAGASEGEARSVAMSAIVFMEIIYLFSSRWLNKAAIGKGFFSNKWIFIGAGLTLLLQICVIYLPVMNSLFKTEPITLTGWLPILASMGTLFIIVELEKIVMRRFSPQAKL